MKTGIKRRDFLQMAAASSAFYFAGSKLSLFAANPNQKTRLISPGCRGTKVKIARIYMGTSHGLWPKPNMDFNAEIKFYKAEFAKLKEELSDVTFVVDELVTSPEDVQRLKQRLLTVDGILAIHPAATARSTLLFILTPVSNHVCLA